MNEYTMYVVIVAIIGFTVVSVKIINIFQTKLEIKKAEAIRKMYHEERKLNFKVPPPPRK